MNLAGSLMKKEDLSLKTLRGLAPRCCGAPPTGYIRTAVSPGAVPFIGMNGLLSPTRIRDLTHLIYTRLKPFSEISRRGCHSGGGKAPRTSMEIGMSIEHKKKFGYFVTFIPGPAGGRG